jgi:DNA-binding NarL/FixJ family response regulator
MKREATKKVLQAVRAVLTGRLYINPKVAMMMAERWADGASPAPAGPVARLSDRELEVFRKLGAGRGTRQIANEMNLSLKTVQTFMTRMKGKLGVNTITELLREAVRHEGDSGPASNAAGEPPERCR